MARVAMCGNESACIAKITMFAEPGFYLEAALPSHFVANKVGLDLRNKSGRRLPHSTALRGDRGICKLRQFSNSLEQNEVCVKGQLTCHSLAAHS